VFFLELASVVLNVLFLVFFTLEKKISWVLGGIGSLLGAYIFFSTKLYSESVLYLFYAAIAVYGYVQWSKPKIHITIKKVAVKHTLFFLTISIGFSILLGLIMSKTDADKTYYDAASTGFSLVATFMEIYKYALAWYFWIGINLFSIWLYQQKELNLFTVQMALFTLLSINGAYQWHRKTQLS
jgi:nicotinamide mononucleotide transporter